MKTATKQAQAKHTPTPWIADAEAHIYGPLGAFVCVTGYSDAELCEQHKLDAAFIVRACNAQDDLLAALHEIDEYTRNLTQRPGINNPFEHIGKIAQAAIAKAEA